MDVDIATGDWYDVADVDNKMKTGLVRAAFRNDVMVQKVIVRGGTLETVQYLDVSDAYSILRWHAENYPSVRGEIWMIAESGEDGFARKGLIASAGESVDLIIVERTDRDGDLISEEVRSETEELIERIEYRYNSDKEIIDTRTYDRCGVLVGIELGDGTC